MAALTACTAGGTGGDGTGTSGAAGAGELSAVGPFEVHSLDPSTSGGFFTRLEVAETLVDADERGDLRAGLATAWEPAPDGLSWTFRLREGARFHDGTPVTAEAVAACLDVAREKAGTPLTEVPVATVRAEGGSVVVELSEPFAPLPAVLAHTSAQVLAPSAYGPDGAVREVVGSGPYRVADLQQPSRIDVVAFDGWDGRPPAVEAISYQAVGRAESRALMAESGQADVTFGMDPVSLARVRDADGLDVESVTLPRTIQVKVDGDHPVLGDVRVRRALSLALDREAMARALLRDPEMAATQLFPPSLQQWHSDAVAPLRHDPAAARALLAQAGWTPGEDGVLQRDGQRLELELRTFPDRPELPVIATAVQSALEEVGIALAVQVGSSSEIPAGHQDGSLELGLYARSFALVPDPLVTLLEDFGPTGAGFGAMGWSDRRVTAALDELAAGAQGERAAALRTEVADVLQEQLPVIPVAWYRQNAVVSDRVDGLVLDPLERSWRLSDVRWAS
ncbi:ABC transporter substrate-binding protein [Quadrisphaera sp. DSM 44207]|uniref:ABC transporter substrate-binding protein n=1 Tax=Quadrisphaera sp. DSM 44207 TaxID=1881057 RepID=UPI001C408F22|nr:ABC transporter substrate-binding protein [Quadrisphaera sp. DSM 44207]